MAVESFGQSLSPGNEQRDYWGSQGRRRAGQPQPDRDQEPGHRRAGRGADQGAGPRQPRRPHPRARPGAAVGLLRDPALPHRDVRASPIGTSSAAPRSRRNTASASIPGGSTRRRSRRSRPRRARCRRARRSRPPFPPRTGSADTRPAGFTNWTPACRSPGASYVEPVSEARGPAMRQFGIGQPVRRVEDRRFLTGRGRYLDDIVRPRQAHAAMLRSPHAHARIRAIDTAAALAAPGVCRRAYRRRSGRATASARSRASARSPTATARRCRCRRGRRIVTRPGAACRRHGRARRRRDRRAGARRRRSDRGRLRAAAGGRRDRRRRSIPASRRCGTITPATCCFDWEIGDRAAAERARGGGAASRVADPRQQPGRRQFDGAARRDRRIRSGRGCLHAVEFDAGLAFPAQPARRACFPCPGEPHPGRHPRCRRRLRDEAVPLSRARAGAVGREKGWAGRSNGSPTARKPSSPTRRGATTSPSSIWRSTRSFAFSACRSS